MSKRNNCMEYSGDWLAIESCPYEYAYKGTALCMKEEASALLKAHATCSDFYPMLQHAYHRN